MPTLSHFVSKTQVTAADIFTFRIGASFNGLQGSIADARIVFAVPDALSITLPPVFDPVRDISLQLVDGMQQVTVMLGAIEDLGLSMQVEFDCQFAPSTPSGTQFANTATLFIDGEIAATQTAEPVLFTSNAHFVLQAERTLPTAVAPAVGGVVYVQLALVNQGDAGAGMQASTLTATLPQGLSYRTDFAILGEDASPAAFAQTNADGVQGVVEGNTLTFSLPAYSGTRYLILYAVQIDANLAADTAFTLPIAWRIGEEVQSPAAVAFTVVAPQYDVQLGKYGPTYTLPSQPISYTLSLQHTGNMPISGFALEEALPLQVEFSAFTTGTFIQKLSDTRTLPLETAYFITYQTAEEESGQLGPFVANQNTTVWLADLPLANGDRITLLRWQLGSLPMGARQQVAPTLDGLVMATVAQGTTLENRLHGSWTVDGTMENIYASHTAQVQDICVLQARLGSIATVGGGAVVPLSTLRVQLRMDCSASHVQNPVFACYLPAGLSYVGLHKAQYNRYFSTSPAPQTPTVSVSDADDGRTLVAWRFADAFAYDFPQRTVVRLWFDVQVPAGASADLPFQFLLGTAVHNGEVPSNLTAHTDVDNLAQDGIANAQYAATPVRTVNIARIALLTSDKKAQGALDVTLSEAPAVGNTYAGGLVRYQLTATNVGNLTFTSLHLVDILPHVGDTDVLTDTPRQSDFAVYPLLAPIVHTSNPTAAWHLQYATGTQPLRFDALGNPQGVDDWSDAPPQDTTALRAFAWHSTTPLLPTQSIALEVLCVAPLGTPTDAVCWNSFALRATYLDGQNRTQALLPVAPEKVGVRIVAPATPYAVGGTVWLTDRRDGVLSSKAQGVNDVIVQLLDAQGAVYAATLTAPDFDGTAGQFRFVNLPAGTYRLQIVPDTATYHLTARHALGNRFDAATQQTGTFSLSASHPIWTLDGALYAKTAQDFMEESMTAILATNRSAQRMVRHGVKYQMLLQSKLEDSATLATQDFT